MTVQADARVSLFLNNGSQSNPTVVVLLSPEMLDEQLNQACKAFVDHTVKVNIMSVEDVVHRGVSCVGQVSAKLRYPGVAKLVHTVCGSTIVEPYAGRIQFQAWFSGGSGEVSGPMSMVAGCKPPCLPPHTDNTISQRFRCSLLCGTCRPSTVHPPMLTALSTDGLEAKANLGAQGVPGVRKRSAAARDLQGHGPLQPALRRECGNPRAVGS